MIQTHVGLHRFNSRQPMRDAENFCVPHIAT